MWLIIGLLSPFFFTATNYLDKYILTREIPNPLAMPIITALVSAAYGVIFWIVGGFTWINPLDAGLAMLGGMTGLFASVLYFQVIKATDEVSVFVVLLQITPLWVLLLSFVLLGERLTWVQLLAFFMILTAAVGLSLRQSEADGSVLARLLKSRELLWAVAITALFSVGVITFRYVSGSYGFFQLAAYESWGLGIGGIILYSISPKVRGAFVETLPILSLRVFGLAALNETFFVAGKTSRLASVSLAPSAALAAVLGSTQVFTAILIGWLLSVLVPSIYRERIGAADLLTKGAWAAVILGGIILLQ
ncbi:MAG: EamA family transporter [Chloroflexi bacterium]|nr:EamA family transporter [Chloroflexota bacterium]